MAAQVSSSLGGTLCTIDFNFSLVFFWVGDWVGIDPDGVELDGAGVLSHFREPGHCVKVEYLTANDLSGVRLEEVV